MDASHRMDHHTEHGPLDLRRYLVPNCVPVVHTRVRERGGGGRRKIRRKNGGPSIKLLPLTDGPKKTKDGRTKGTMYFLLQYSCD
jgi:hypothetical protein